MTIAVVRLINGGVLKKFPELNVVISHCGGAISSLKGRIRMYQDRSAWADGMVLTSFEEFDLLFDRLYFDTAGHGGWVTIVKSALLSIKAERLLFGTEYPKEMLTPKTVLHFIHAISGLDLSPKDRQRILGDNAARLLNLQ
jgi:predicted TIM-barrel fold metal-dependent hydrolase